MIEYIRLKHIKEGDVLAKPLYQANGRLLASKGSRVTDRSLAFLRDFGYRGLYIEHDSDVRRELIPVQKPWLTDEDQQEMIFALANTFSKNSFLHDPYDASFAINRRTLEGKTREICRDLLAIWEKEGLIYEFDDIRNDRDWILYHSLNVCLLSVAVAIEMGVREQELYDFALGAVLHDLGKVEFPLALINKEGLSEEERAPFRKHPETLFRILQRQEYRVPTTYAIWQHHEYADGSGYPKGLSGDTITQWGRILALTNTFDNMTHHTPYKDTVLSASDAMELLYADPRFDTDYVRALSAVVAVYPVGSRLLLSNGETALVVKNTKNMPLRPMVVAGSSLIDLSREHFDITVERVMEEE